MRIKKVIMPVLILTLIFPASALCQIVYNQPASTNLKFHYSSWNLEKGLKSGADSLGTKDEISQRMVSLSGFIPIRENFEARYYLVTSSNSIDYNNTESELSGFGDARIQLSHSFSDDRILLSAGLNLPTGKRELDTGEEREVIEFLSRDYLSLPIRRYGEGFGINLLAGAAAELGGLKLGASAMFNHTGTYTPYEGSGDYDPGDAFSLGANSNLVLGKVIWAADIGYTIIGTDRLDGDDIYKQSGQFLGQLSGTYVLDPYSVTVGARAILRGRNERYSLSTGAVESQLEKYGDEFDAFTKFVYAASGGWNLSMHIATRQIAESEESLGSSSIYNFGFGIVKEISHNLSFDIGGIYHTGSTETEDADLSGIQASAGIRVVY